jgi:hypothetical protein
MLPLLLYLSIATGAPSPAAYIMDADGAETLRLAAGGVAIEGVGELAAVEADADRCRLADAQSGLAVDLRITEYELSDGRAVRYGGWIHNRGDRALRLGTLSAARLEIGARPGGGGVSYEPLAYMDDEWYGSAYWSGPDWTRVGRDWQHTGAEVSSCRTFVAPRAGLARVRGRVRKGDTNGGDGVVAIVRHNGAEAFVAEVEAKDDVGVEHDLTLDLAEGDRVRFVLHRRGGIGYDTTYWDPLIEYIDGPEYQASDGFGDEGSPWTYELERDLSEGTSVPTVRAPDGQFQWRGVPVVTSEAAEVRSRVDTTHGEGRLPCFIYTGERPDASLLMAPVSRGLWSLRAAHAADGTGLLELRCQPPGGSLTLAPGESVPFPDVVLVLTQGEWREARDRVGVTGELPFRLAHDPLGLSGLSSTERAPAPATSLAAHRGPGGATLTWSGRAEEKKTAFVVLRDGRLLASTDRPSYHDPASAEGLSHRYAVASADGYVLSEPSSAWEDATPQWRSDVPARLAHMVEADWEQSDAGAIAERGYDALAGDALEAARRLLRGRGPAADRLRAELGSMDEIMGNTDPRSRYLNARWLRRAAMLSHPLLAGRELLFVKRVPPSYSHLVMQYFGWRARPGGGLFVLEEPGWSLTQRPLLDPAEWRGSVLAPSLSWDAGRVVFSYSSCDPSDPYYRLFELDVATGAAQQLTDGPYEDLMPGYLPQGDVVFVSTRRRGHARCFGAQFGEDWHVYTLHRLHRPKGEVRTLSYHETNEWFPSLLPDGSLSYARWDYVDRHAVLHQNLWRTNPDGTSPVALWGNHTQNPHCSFEAQPVPGSTKLLCTASAHHSITGGSLILIDPKAGYDGPGPMERLTPDVPFPESEAIPSQYYASPWPLSEDLYLCAYSPSPLIMEPAPNEPAALGLYLLDRQGNRELLYREPGIGCANPIPLQPRPAPPVRPTILPADAGDAGTFAMEDVYRGLDGVARGSVRALRVVQVLPKTTPVADDPPIGLAGQEPARAVLGTVPVAEDGSAHFSAPAGVPVLFQALDAEGRAVQTMRSATYLQPGETAMCIGCHEPRDATPAGPLPRALREEPSAITPGPDGTRPFSYPRLVQPILDRHCIDCHGDDEPAGGLPLTGTAEGQWSRSYVSLMEGPVFLREGTNPENAADSLVPRYGAWNPVHRTVPGGRYGSLGSRLLELLEAGHSGAELKDAELRRLALWIDCNGVFYGTYDRDDQRAQLAGEVVPMPQVQ